MSTETRPQETSEDKSDPREPFEWLADHYDEGHPLGRAARTALQSLDSDKSEAN